MSKIATAIAAAISLAVPSIASAKPMRQLPLARGTQILAEFERQSAGTVYHCHRDGPLRVVCAFVEPAEEQTEGGWTQGSQMRATLSVHRQRVAIELVGWVEVGAVLAIVPARR